MNEVNAAIITIGDELLIGQTIDTNGAFIAQELNKLGIWVEKRIAIGDIREEILQTLSEQAAWAQVVIITGGLGPTADDITKPALCEYFGSRLLMNEAVEQHVAQIFARNNRAMTDRNRKQAEVPHNCTVLHNERGTAPGMWFEKGKVVYVALPGVPIEMMGLIEKEVVPKLKDRFTLPHIIHKTAVTFGHPESALADTLKDFEAALPAYIKLAYLPNYRLVKLRLTAKGTDKTGLEKETNDLFQTLKKLVTPWLVAEADVTMPEIIGNLLKEKAAFVATAESCTGGYIAHLLTSRSGSSDYYKGSVVSYANEVKEAAIGVQQTTLQTHGAVSEQTVTEMARGVLNFMNVDYAIATSGIMGPGGGTPQKPVGTVWIAVADKEKTVAQKCFVHMDRKRNIEMTATIALNMLRQLILQNRR